LAITSKKNLYHPRSKKQETVPQISTVLSHSYR